ncbi:hypothetical protein GCM10010503_14400 [Streptomyces lucensis JCM 4490]|uniref:Uncharacterized protein n=1 Tax=Streptomyces lucensis JCM 4490 TaxID=1306176 RepID=A0A918J0C8_9ACTN|nr:hypothetical protein [Streptomyces lucensis]GGW39247.1 hypothetical protein GCM10010503_14400 [Streptomyces lucensis JCM 4490]
MTDRTTGSGDERYPTGRFTRPPEDEWAPGDPESGHRAPREARPGERLPGEPSPDEGADRMPDEGAGRGQAGPGRMPDEGMGRMTEGTGRMPDEGAGRAPDEGTGRMPDEGMGRMRGGAGRMPDEGAGRMPGEGAGRMHDDPGEGSSGLFGKSDPATVPGSGEARARGAEAYDRPHGSEGLRPGTEDLGADTTRAPGGDAAPAPGQRRMPDDGLGAPSAGAATAHGGAAGDGGHGSARGTAAPAASGQAAGAGTPLMSYDETDRWEQRMRQVAAGFVDEPRGAVVEADRALEEIAERFTDAVTRRRRTLRASWEGGEEHGPGAETDTEQLRLALRDYRELAGRLLHG